MVEHRERVAHVGVPRVQLGMLAVAVAALVPGHDAPSAGCQLRREDVVGPSEVEAAVDEHERRGGFVAPFVDGDSEPVGIDGVLAGGVLGAGVRVLGRGGVRRHLPEGTSRARARGIAICVASLPMDRSSTISIVMLVAVLAAGTAACGTTDPAAQERLPPIRTTVATTTTTTTTIPPGQRFYTVKDGDTVGKIAAAFQVTVESIVQLNALVSPDAIQAGQTLEIPAGVVVIAELPQVATTAP